MNKLKLGSIADERPVRMTLELPATTHRQLVAYAEVLGQETGQRTDPIKLIALMIARFIASDRAFAKARRAMHETPPVSK